jgi:hypothetical protein
MGAIINGKSIPNAFKPKTPDTGFSPNSAQKAIEFVLFRIPLTAPVKVR